PPATYQQAIALFDQLAGRTDLAFGYPKEACFARAHILCEDALDEGFMPKKAWAIDKEKKSRFVFTTPNGKRIRHWCHAAMAMPVKAPDDKIEDLVFDPALFDGPVSLAEWGRTINAPPESLEIKRLGAPPTKKPPGEPVTE